MLQSILIKPASGLCNMQCDYCFYSDEAAKREQCFLIPAQPQKGLAGLL